MKTKAVLIALITVLALTAFLVQSCSKDEEKANTPPTCIITSPTNGQVIQKGDSVTISVVANDSDGTISEVRFAIDGVGKGLTSSYPYKFTWATNSESPGNHSLKATSIDSEGGSKTNEISITVVDDVGTFTDPRDEQSYDTVKIGSQTWMAENLNYDTPNSYWLYNSSANGDVFGRLYGWDVALTACPTGWHLPSDDEWKTLEMALGMSQSEVDTLGFRGTDQGTQMKSVTHWLFDGNGTTSSGFNGLPGGKATNQWEFSSGSGWWWSKSWITGTGTLYRTLDIHGKVGRYGEMLPHRYYSVRCVKD
ncbi:MAG: FISUMP domain-containing protein [Bacteroidales bacterium]|jgi:uncharacterized protein (TIGR02145 family)